MRQWRVPLVFVFVTWKVEDRHSTHCPGKTGCTDRVITFVPQRIVRLDAIVPFELAQNAGKEECMLFLFGVRTKSKPIQQIRYPCSKCSRATVFTAMESKRWF